jgi:hypothetical protein
MPPAFRPLLALAFCLLPFAFLSAQTIGQYELRKRTSTGFTAYGITLSNGQVIGQTAGIPAAITPVVSGDLSAYLTSSTAASTYQPLDSQLTTLSALADSAGVLKNNGGGTLSYQAVSSGALAANAGKIVEFSTAGTIHATAINAMSEGSVAPYTQAGPTAFYFVPSYGMTGTLATATLTANRAWTLPDTTGTIITTGDTGTVTSTMLAGSIANSKLATDPLNASNLTSGTVPTGRLGSGTANSTTYLRGDNTWATVTGGVTSITGTANEITVTGTTTPTLSLPSALTFTGKTITGGTFSSPTLTTPALGTPSAIVLTNATGSPTGISLTKAQLNTIVSDDDPAYVGTANTFSAAQTISVAGANSTPPLYLTGALNVGGSATTTFPHIFHQPTGATAATTWSAGTNAGTVFGANEATGFTGNFFDGKVAGVTTCKIIGSTGAMSVYTYNGINWAVYDSVGGTLRSYEQGGRWFASDGFTTTSSGLSMQDTYSGIRLRNSFWIGWSADTTYYGTNDLILGRDAAATLQLGADHATTATNQRIKSHDVTTGTGASLTLSGGTGSVAGGSVILATSATTGAPAARITVSATGGITMGSNGTAFTQIKRATCTLVAGTATVTDTDTTANTHVSIMVSTSAGTIGTGYTVTVSAGTGYTITAIGSVLETSTLVLKATHF